MGNVQERLVAASPAPVWLVNVPGGDEWFSPPFAWDELLAKIDRNLLMCSFRGVGFDRLSAVLRNGIDVEPTTAVIFADDFDKAWEYGGWPRLLLALDESKLERSYMEVAATVPSDELEARRARFPTMLKSTDGTMLWLSRLPESDPRLASPYETAYARWIEDDPFNVLRAIMVFARPEDKAKILSLASVAS